MPISEKCVLFKKLELPSDIIHRSYHMNHLLSILTDDNYYYCSTAREFNTMCGENAKYYKSETEEESENKDKTSVINRI